MPFLVTLSIGKNFKSNYPSALIASETFLFTHDCSVAVKKKEKEQRWS